MKLVRFLRGDAWSFDVSGGENATTQKQPKPDAPPAPSLSESFRELSLQYNSSFLVPSMNRDPRDTYVLPARSPSDTRKYTVLLDLDETLVYGREGPLWTRPGLKELLQFLKGTCETVVWTAGARDYAQQIIKTIDRDTKAIEHCIYRHPKWFDHAGYWKDLELVGRDVDYTILIDNSPNCIRGQATRSILVSDFWGEADEDTTLPAIQRFLSGLVQSGLPVPQYIPKSEMVSLKFVNTPNGNELYLYTLNLPEEDARTPPYTPTHPPTATSNNCSFISLNI
eukprot:NODE_3626_length_931_cov_52.038557_g3474_i0.p1 GENE.NODE_3626_length_931_cov_52.038557_g3474_i0~~NODE_3626_length_931_cov_52.038557_g3474_i0.p1  ORF type:complete len:289 (-),score=59.24 NODE_3626_length_931_cov_52.038557_g3474_i0:65-910(-)